MRTRTALLLFACAASAQFRSTVPLVVAPTTITDSKGRVVDGLDPADLVLYDNNVPQPAQMDWSAYPISLVVAVQASSNAGPVLDKLGGSGILLSQLLAADAGETAVLSFSDHPRLHQDFTADSDAVAHALRRIRIEGEDAVALDAIREALRMLERRGPGRRRIILMIAETRDRGSDSSVADVVREVQRQNAAIYWLTFSPFLEPFTVKNKTTEDLKPEDERTWKGRKHAEPVVTDIGPGGYVYAIQELIRMHKTNLADLFTRATGARSIAFLQRKALEQAIQAIGEEVHRQYILSFQPKPGTAGDFHAIRVEVKGRPDLQVKTREGYWAVE